MTTKTFRDSVHGYIELPMSCVRIIDTPEFQRLRRLKQLAVTEYVFPNATHTRFEHSLGVAHVAGKILRQIQCKQPEWKITDADIEMIQIAGLVHDLGHAPFSHTYEHAKPGFRHERNGFDILKRLQQRGIISDQQLLFAKGCMAYLIVVDTDVSKKWHWMIQLINNTTGGLDADRLDYCMRDAQIASVKVTFDLDRLIRAWRVTPDGEFHFPAKLHGDVFAVHRARFLMFDTVYNHRVVRIIDAMMTDVLKLLEPDIDPTRDGDDIVFHFATSQEPRHVAANAILRRIQRRDLYREANENENADEEIQVVAHYGCLEENPLKRTRFTPDLDPRDIDILCPSTFLSKRTIRLAKTT